MLLHEEVDDSGFVSLSRLGPCLKDKDLEMEALMLQDETLLGTMQSYMDASLISLIEDFGSLGEVSWSWACSVFRQELCMGAMVQWLCSPRTMAPGYLT